VSGPAQMARLLLSPVACEQRIKIPSCVALMGLKKVCLLFTCCCWCCHPSLHLQWRTSRSRWGQPQGWMLQTTCGTGCGLHATSSPAGTCAGRLSPGTWAGPCTVPYRVGRESCRVERTAAPVAHNLLSLPLCAGAMFVGSSCSNMVLFVLLIVNWHPARPYSCCRNTRATKRVLLFSNNQNPLEAGDPTTAAHRRCA
jgi:hypothetical protein